MDGPWATKHAHFGSPMSLVFEGFVAVLKRDCVFKVVVDLGERGTMG